jgi:hypothetical protein
MLLLSKFVANKVKDSHCHGFNCELDTVFNDLYAFCDLFPYQILHFLFL